MEVEDLNTQSSLNFVMVIFRQEDRPFLSGSVLSESGDDVLICCESPVCLKNLQLKVIFQHMKPRQQEETGSDNVGLLLRLKGETESGVNLNVACWRSACGCRHVRLVVRLCYLCL